MQFIWPLSVLIGQEKGIDIRIALDIIRYTLDGAFDVALVFSQDQDLSEAAEDISTDISQSIEMDKNCLSFPY